MTALKSAQEESPRDTARRLRHAQARNKQLPKAPGRYAEDGWPLARPFPMHPTTQKAFHKIVLALLPPAPAPSWDGMAESIARRVRVLMSYMHPMAARALIWMIRVVDWAPIWRLKSFKRLRKQTREQASRLLDQLAASRFGHIRQVVAALRAAVLSAYYDATVVHQAMNYMPEPFIASRLALHHRLKKGGAVNPDDYMVPPVGITP